MATRAEERQRLRERRLEREARRRKRDGRLLMIAAATLGALVVVGALVALSQRGAGGDGGVEGAAEVAAHLDAIPQRGAFLGDPEAPVTVVEFGDLQCPVCRDYAESVVGPLIDRAVRDGAARLEFRNWAILGEDSARAAAAAYAAGEQNRLWHFVELFFRNQGFEGSGYVTDEFLRSVAEGAGVPDLARWERDRSAGRWERAVARADRQAQRLGFTGTPSFLLVGPHGSEPIGTPHSSGHLEAAIAAAG